MARPHRRRVPAPGEAEKPFLLPIEDVFSISGRGTVVTGRIERGVMNVGDAAELVGFRAEPQSTSITGIESFQRTLEQGLRDENVGVVLRDIDKASVERGMVLAKPGSIAAHTRFKAEIELLEGKHGPRPAILSNESRLQILLHALQVSVETTLSEARELLPLGETATLTLTLPHHMAIEAGLKFELRENGRTIGAGRVLEIFD